MSPPQRLRIATDDGEFELRFDSIMNNLDAGDFVVLADKEASRWQLQQQVSLDGGGVHTFPFVVT